MAKRKTYDDKFRAGAVVMLQGAGYPEKDGALSQVSKHLGVPISTLRGWFTQQHNPPPAQVRNETKLDIVEAINAELDGIFTQMQTTRADASYRDLGVVAGILFDKKQLLEGKPTENVNISDDRLTDDDRMARLAALADKGRTRRVGLAADIERVQ